MGTPLCGCNHISCTLCNLFLCRCVCLCGELTALLCDTVLLMDNTKFVTVQ